MAAEKEQLATVMLQHGIEWKKKETHEKHLLVLDFEKKERQRKLWNWKAKKAELQEENAVINQAKQQEQIEAEQKRAARRKHNREAR